MQKERFFDALSLSLGARPKTNREKSYSQKLTRENIIKHMSKGGYFVVFWSKNVAVDTRVGIEIEFGLDQSQYYWLAQGTPEFDRVLFVLLDDTPLPEKMRQVLETAPESVVRPVQLFSSGGRSEKHRIDDLIVRLYWLIYRNTQGQSGLE